MTAGDDHERELGGDEALAAELVLGALAADERQAAQRRVETEPAFARLVDDWEARLAPMAAAYSSELPPDTVKPAIDRRLFASTPAAPAAPARAGLWDSLAFWRGLAMAAVAAAAILVVVPLATGPEPVTQAPVSRLVASLSADQSDVRYLALYDGAEGVIGLSHVAGERDAGHDFELWVIEGDDAPVSLGVIPAGEAVQVPVTEAERALIAGGAVFAISLEPAGGSPTGAPTGPVVAAGDLRGI